MLTGVTPTEIHGDTSEGVSGISVMARGGAVRRFDCDAVGMGWHLRPETQIADLARCRFGFDASARQWLPETDDDGRTSSERVYLAGDGARILGARCAEVTGELAALAALADLGIVDQADRRRELAAQKSRYRRFADGLAQAFPWPHALAARVADRDDRLPLRKRHRRDATRQRHRCGRDRNQSRQVFQPLGMGRCQGRYCGNAAAEIVAAARGETVEAAGRLRGQAPVKPIGIGTARRDS